MLEFRNARFLKSAPDISERPDTGLREIIIVGKSNVGKSSLINALCDNKSLAYTSGKPGHTRLLNYYEIDRSFYLVDAPGYGYSAAGRKNLEIFARMMEGYFKARASVKGVVFLMDSRHKPSQDDLDFHDFIKGSGIPFILVMTKTDKLNQKETHAMKANLREFFPDLPEGRFIPTSAVKPDGILSLRKAIAGLIAE